MRIASLHKIRLPGELPPACVSTHEEADFILSLRFAAARDQGDPICAGNTLEGDLGIEQDRAAAAVAWILDLDSSAKRRFLKGSAISREIRPTPVPLPSLQEGTSPEDYWSLRQPVADLVRPLFFEQPSESQLFPYQHEGVDWLLAHDVGVLADDMGLGKTLQAITAVRKLISSGQARQALVVCPKTLLANWETELTKWAPELSRLRVTPQGKDREEAWRAILGRVHVVITNYEQLREPPEALFSRPIDILIADEAHKVRNLDALVTRGIRRLEPQRFWALTGTPIERDPEDLVTLLSSMVPEKFSLKDATLAAGALRARVRPYILRRLKDDILDQLPEVLESVETLDLHPLQQRSYRAALKAHRGGDGPGSILTLTNQLRTICDFDPETGASIKGDRIAEILENISRAGEKAVVFSFLLEPLRLIEERVSASLGPSSTVRLEGAMESSDREEAVRRFREDDSVCALLASLRVAGEGLTLTEANHVIFFNEWWNPSANHQARDRVVRIGQTRGVRVYKFRCRNTIEDWLAEILVQKSELVDLIIDRLARPSDGKDSLAVSVLEELEHEIERERND